MTMIPIFKTCSICKRKYFWNPDVGEVTCPRCKNLVPIKIFRKFTKNRNSEGEIEIR